MTYRTLALLFAALIFLPTTFVRHPAIQDGTPDATCASRPIGTIEFERDEIEGYLNAPDAPEKVEDAATLLLTDYVHLASRADVQGILGLMTPELAEYFGWGCDPRMDVATPEAEVEATPAPTDYAIEQVRLYDDDTATAFLSLPDRVHDTTAGKVYDRVFFIVLERTDGVWKIDRIGTEILITDAESNEPAYLPALELRDHGMPEE